MSNNSLIDVIEELLEAQMTKKDQVKNPQEEENDSVEEALDVETGNTKPEEIDNGAGKVHDGDTLKPTADNDSPNAEPNKNETGAKPMTDEGGSKGDNASDASAEVAADKPAHDQESDPIETPMKDDSDPKKKVSEEEEVTEEDEALEEADELSEKEECDEEEEEEEKAYEEVDTDEVSDTVQEIADNLEAALKGETVSEEGQDTTVQKNANDEQLPDEDKETLNTEMDDATTAEADKGSHNQESDPNETPTKANPKGVAEESEEAVAEESEEAVAEEAEEEVEEDSMDETVNVDIDASEKEDEEEMDEATTEELTAKQKELDKNKNGKIDGEDLAKLRKEEAESEEVEEVSEEDNLDEDFKKKAAIVFETAVNEKVLSIREEIQKEFDDKLIEEKESLEEKFSEYVDYATQEWLKENSLEIKYSLRTEIAENFIRGLKGLFEENYIEIPDDEVSVVDELTEAVEGYKDRLGEQEEMLENLQKEVLSFKKSSIVDSISEGLTETQKIRLEKLSESVEADDVGEFQEKLEALKEAHFESPESAAKVLSSYGDEVYSMNENAEMHSQDHGPVSQYAKYLSKTVLK